MERAAHRKTVMEKASRPRWAELVGPAWGLLVGLVLVMAASPAFAGGVGSGCSVFKPCDRGLSCQPFVHKCYHKPRWEGEPCSAGYGCRSGLTCEAFSHKCRGPAKVNETCHATRPCGPGLTCEAGSQKCRRPGREGESCHATRPCGRGLTCEAGAHKCRRPGRLGDACHATRPCGGGLSCQPGVHKCYHTPRKAGEPCSAGYGCGKGLYCQSFLHKCVPSTIDYKKKTPCNALRVHATAEDAKRAGVTMTFGAGSSGGAGAFFSYETGLVYGENGQFGCYVTACLGNQADVSIGNFANFGLFNRFEDFQGFSVVTGGGADVPFIELGFQTSQVWRSKVPTSAKSFAKRGLIGTSSGLSFGVGLNPVNVNYAMCYTEVLDDGDLLRDFSGIDQKLKAWAKNGFDPGAKPAGVDRPRTPRPTPPPPRGGRTISLRTAHNRYVVAEADGRARANRPKVGAWERWTMVSNSNGTVSFRSHHGKYLVAEADGRALANRDRIGAWEQWRMKRHGDGTVSFRSHHGKYLVAEANGELNANRAKIGPWERFRMSGGSAPPPARSSVSFEPGMDRPGSDYKGFDISANPKACKKRCESDPRCKAYTYVKPGVQGPRARCYLKDPAPAARPNRCCTSGIRGGGASSRVTFEPGMDRPGSDYKGFDISANPKACKKRCESDPRCKAYTYVKPGVQGPRARCYLKDPAPAARPNGCCTSGVRR